jgi:hypothetical protein
VAHQQVGRSRAVAPISCPFPLDDVLLLRLQLHLLKSVPEMQVFDQS